MAYLGAQGGLRNNISRQCQNFSQSCKKPLKITPPAPACHPLPQGLSPARLGDYIKLTR
jgi:hypothetical protein